MALRSSDNDYWSDEPPESRRLLTVVLVWGSALIGLVAAAWGTLVLLINYGQAVNKGATTPSSSNSNSVVNLNIPNYFYWVLLGICGLVVLGIFAYLFYKSKLARDRLRRETELQERES
jgi:hypothetical protein